jgi:hypothetical protein
MRPNRRLRERLRRGGGARRVKWNLVSSLLPNFVLSSNERSNLVSDWCVPCEKFFPVDRLAPIESLEVFAQRHIYARIVRPGAPRLIVQMPTPSRAFGLVVQAGCHSVCFAEMQPSLFATGRVGRSSCGIIGLGMERVRRKANAEQSPITAWVT